MASSTARKVLLGIDIGTATSLAGVLFQPGGRTIWLSGYQNDWNESNRHYVPSEIYYKSNRRKRKVTALEKPDILSGWDVRNALRTETHRIHEQHAGLIKTPKNALNPMEADDITSKDVINIEGLIQVGTITQASNVLLHYLMAFLDDIHRILCKGVEDADHKTQRLQPNDELRFAFSYPLTWNAKSCRQFEAVVDTALRKSAFKYTSGSFFLVHEAEAATYAIMREHKNYKFETGDYVGILDLGAGTSDASVYEVAREPVRFVKEVCMPAAIPFGGHRWNEDMERELDKMLRNHPELDDTNNKVTREGLKQRQFSEFEIHKKHLIDLRKTRLEFYIYPLPRLEYTVKDQQRLFFPTISRISKFVTDMTKKVADDSEVKNVKYWILTGGFSNSSPVVERLKIHLNGMENSPKVLQGQHQDKGTGVVMGLIERLRDVKASPEHFLRISLGVTRHHLTTNKNDPRAYPDLPVKSHLDGLLRIEDGIDWKIQKGGSDKQVFNWDSEYHFETREEEWRAHEVFWCSDKRQLVSKYSYKHPKNEGAEQYVTATFDVTELRDKKLVKRTVPRCDQEGEKHYSVRLRIEVKIIDRNLAVSAHFPGYDTVFRAQLPIASAFPAGTM